MLMSIIFFSNPGSMKLQHDTEVEEGGRSKCVGVPSAEFDR